MRWKWLSMFLCRCAGHPNLDSGLIGRNGPAQAVRNSKITPPALVPGSLVSYPVLGVQRHKGSDSHPPLGICN